MQSENKLRLYYNNIFLYLEYKNHTNKGTVEKCEIYNDENILRVGISKSRQMYSSLLTDFTRQF